MSPMGGEEAQPPTDVFEREGPRMMTKMRLEWREEVVKRQDDLVARRRDFHRHPELSHQERRTAEIIAERLHAATLEVRTGIGGTGVVGVLHGDRPGRTIAGRADIDALPLTEILEAPFASGTPGVMHACGHDGHTAIAITLAESLAARRAEVPGTAVFIFQPAEEVLGGARPMIQAGVLENPHVEEVPTRFPEEPAFVAGGGAFRGTMAPRLRCCPVTSNHVGDFGQRCRILGHRQALDRRDLSSPPGRRAEVRSTREAVGLTRFALVRGAARSGRWQPASGAGDGAGAPRPSNPTSRRSRGDSR